MFLFGSCNVKIEGSSSGEKTRMVKLVATLNFATFYFSTKTF